jgi:DNA-directed RNA polymerase subunit RPC12/RpoP
MIVLNFGRFSHRGGRFLFWERIYWHGWRWTPFCRIEKRYKSWFGYWSQYIYRCPKCGQEFNGEKPNKPGTLCLACPHCNYQSLVIGDADKPYLLNPGVLKDGIELCSYGCHYAEPYGFVPMAGCPIHD